MHILVTGANGLLGHHVVAELLKLRHTVAIIVRSKKNIYFDLSQVKVFEVNFNDYSALKIAANNCDAIIHIAAVTATNLLSYTDYSKVNVDGCATIIKVANDLLINNIVFVSTANSIGFGSENSLANEKNNIQFPFTKSYYAQSKLEAEALFIQASKIANRHVIIVNPTFMIGNYDVKPSSGKLMLMAYKKPLMFIPQGGKNFVAVSDVSTAICNALIMGKNGERYLCAGVNLSFKNYYTLQSNIANYKQFTILVPNIILKLAGKFGDILRFFKFKTDISSMNINQLLIQEYYQNTKAVEKLKMPQTDLKLAIFEALEWFKKNKTIQ